MKALFLFLTAILLFATAPIFAQGNAVPFAPVLPMLEPASPDGSRCFNVFNNAPYSVTGSMITDLYAAADGAQGRQRENFRLKPKESVRICSNGPFYPGERLELVLRTLVPIFSCYTVAQGDIVIMGETKPEGGSKTWVDCQ
jgi:hypothetical protein